MASRLALAAAAVALLATTANAQAYAPNVGFDDPDMSWAFIGCRDRNNDVAAACQKTLGALYQPGYGIAEFQGLRPDGKNKCDTPNPFATWCAVKVPGFSAGQCLLSCDDNGAYVMAGNYYGTQACLGSSGDTCTWFKDQSCQELQPLAQDIKQVAGTIQCLYGGAATGGWCAAAWQAIGMLNPQLSCDAPPPPPPPPPPSDDCKAPTGGPDYGGSAWTCVQDKMGSMNWVPVKLTAWDNACCMSKNSRDCIWADKDCCFKLASSGDGTTPYFECGPIHQSVWGSTGYEDPNSWCNSAMVELGGVPPPPKPTEATPMCTKTFDAKCIGGKYVSSEEASLFFCEDQSTPASYLKYVYKGEDGCGAYGSNYDVTCQVVTGCDSTYDVAFTTVTVPDATAPCMAGPNQSGSVAAACTAACGVSVDDGKGWAGWECKDNTLYCTCTGKV
ncbi:hypothetical protein DFJ74DRAFT_689215 [Hyaloraphidium curvatum]|nr:hypothetical protein DFJ74DRAFT_689215 [Hyaloraphidium curvatum]